VVEDGNVAKFSQNKKLEKLLLATGDKTMCEAAARDRVWGIGFRQDHARQLWTQGTTEGWGENLLGKALMRTRRRIRVAEAEAGVVEVEQEETKYEEED